MEDLIRVMVKMPHEEVGHVEIIKNDLESLQKLVGGYIEVVRLTSDMALIVNEEGILQGLPFNCYIAGVALFGNVIAVGVDEPDFKDVPITMEAWEQFILGRKRK